MHLMTALGKLPGRERARRFGGVGTPEVAEFAAASLGARPGISSGSAHSLRADALDLMIRLPQLWRRVEALEVRASYARFVARRSRVLTVDQATYVVDHSATRRITAGERSSPAAARLRRALFGLAA